MALERHRRVSDSVLGGGTWSGDSPASSQRPRNCGVCLRVLLGGPWLNCAVISSWDVADVLFRRRHTALPVQVLSRLGSDGLLDSEKPHLAFGLFLPVPLDHGPHQLPGPRGFHRDASKCRMVIVIPSTLHLGRSTIESSLSKALHLVEKFVVVVVVVHFGEALWGFVD